MGGGIKRGPPCGFAPARPVRHVDYGGWPRLAIEDQIDGKAIRLSLHEHGSGGSISMPHDVEKSACRATSENACFMTLARLSLARGHGRTRRLDLTFSIQAFDWQQRGFPRPIADVGVGAEGVDRDARDTPTVGWEEAEALFFGAARR